MKLFGIFGKDRAVPFQDFREAVRLAVRRAQPGAKITPNDDGFVLHPEGGPPVSCNLRQLYATYAKNPADREGVIKRWMDALVTEVPDQTWAEAKMTLRPLLRSESYMIKANSMLAKDKEPDFLPGRPFVGQLHVTVIREYGSVLNGVTQSQLDKWGVTLDDALREGLNNMNMMSYPPAFNELLAGGSANKRGQSGEIVGLVFEGDHLMATWLISERFRDHLGMRLEGDYVVITPNRSRLVAVRADEPGLIASVVQSNRNFESQPYALTSQTYHVSAGTTGGTVTVWKGSGAGDDVLDSASPFARGGGASLPGAVAPASPAAYSRPAPVDLSQWSGLTEPTGGTGKLG